MARVVLIANDPVQSAPFEYLPHCLLLAETMFDKNPTAAAQMSRSSCANVM